MNRFLWKDRQVILFECSPPSYGAMAYMMKQSNPNQSDQQDGYTIRFQGLHKIIEISTFTLAIILYALSIPKNPP